MKGKNQGVKHFLLLPIPIFRISDRQHFLLGMHGKIPFCDSKARDVDDGIDTKCYRPNR